MTSNSSTPMSSRLLKTLVLKWRDRFRLRTTYFDTDLPTPKPNLVYTTSSRPSFAQAGFTLVELLVAVTLGALLLVGMFQMMFRTISGGGRATEQAKIKEQGDYMITALERGIRNARNCTGSTSPITLTYLDTSTKVLDVAPGPGSIIFGGQRMISTDIEVVGTPTVTCVPGSDSFEPDSVSISVSLRPAGSSIPPETFVTTINLRNS